MPIDATNIDLVALIEQRTSIRFIHKSTSAGGEWKGSCPFCDLAKTGFSSSPTQAAPTTIVGYVEEMAMLLHSFRSMKT